MINGFEVIFLGGATIFIKNMYGSGLDSTPYWILGLVVFTIIYYCVKSLIHYVNKKNK